MRQLSKNIYADKDFVEKFFQEVYHADALPLSYWGNIIIIG